MRNMHRERCPPFVRSTRSHKIQTVTGQESTPFGSAASLPFGVHCFSSRNYVIRGFPYQGLPFIPWMAPKARSDCHLDL